MNVPSQETVDAFVNSAGFGDIDGVNIFTVYYPHAIDRQGSTGDVALVYAAWANRENIVGLLLDRGAQIDAVSHDGNTALLSAVSAGHEKMVGLLLSRGADLSVVDKRGRTARMLADEMNRVLIVNMIDSHVAAISEKERKMAQRDKDMRVKLRNRKPGSPFGKHKP